jgi:4-amino-4-deoxy-L-arabinose transferase-like glycosyltransferase
MTRLSISIILICAVIWFALLGHRNLIEPDEGRFAGNPSTIVENSDWLITSLNYYKYFEEAGLSYTGTTTAFGLKELNNNRLRLITGLAGFLMALFAMLLARNLYGERPGLYAFLMCISYFMVVILGHNLTLDMLLGTFIFMAIACLLIAQAQRGNQRHVRRWMMTGWAMLALATLTTGPAAIVLPLTSVAIYSLWQRDWQIWRSLHVGKGLVLFLLITAPWFIAVSQSNPEWVSYFFVHKSLQHSSAGIPGSVGPVYFYLPFLFIGVCPWLWTSIRTLFNPSFEWQPLTPGKFQPERFMWVFVLTTLVFYALAQPGFPGYILPALPVLAVMAGERLAVLGYSRADRWTMKLLGVIVVFTAIYISRTDSVAASVEVGRFFAGYIFAAGVLYLLAAIILLRKLSKPILQVASVAILSLTSASLIITGLDSLSKADSNLVGAELVANGTPASAPLLTFKANR